MVIKRNNERLLLEPDIVNFSRSFYQYLPPFYTHLLLAISPRRLYVSPLFKLTIFCFYKKVYTMLAH